MTSVNRKDILIPENIPRKLAPEVFVGSQDFERCGLYGIEFWYSVSHNAFYDNDGTLNERLTRRAIRLALEEREFEESSKEQNKPTLKEFMAEHFEDYITLEHKDHLVYDVFIKFVPFWVLQTYGDCDIEVELHKDFQNDKYKWWNVTIKSR